MAKQGTIQKSTKQTPMNGKDQISEHEVKLLLVFRRNPTRWFTSAEAGESAGIAKRTARAHTANLSRLGVLRVTNVYPGPRFQWAEGCRGEAQAYLERLDKARQVMGLHVKAKA
jgi:hypothetical protein